MSNTADEHQRTLVTLIKRFSYGHHTAHLVFADFVELCALSISNGVDLQQYESREKRYLEIVGKYSRRRWRFFPDVRGAYAVIRTASSAAQGRRIEH